LLFLLFLTLLEILWFCLLFSVILLTINWVVLSIWLEILLRTTSFTFLVSWVRVCVCVCVYCMCVCCAWMGCICVCCVCVRCGCCVCCVCVCCVCVCCVCICVCVCGRDGFGTIFGCNMTGFGFECMCEWVCMLVCACVCVWVLGMASTSDVALD